MSAAPALDPYSMSIRDGEKHHYEIEEFIEAEFNKLLHYRPSSEAENEANSSYSPFIRTPHPSLWHDDGNVILRAQATLFRLHRSILSLHSEVFGDMFKVCSPAAGETIEGCPVVEVQDTARDLTHFLLPLYSGWNGPHTDSLVALPFSVVSAWLRLGNKYQVPHLTAAAISRLSFAYPSSLSVYDAQLRFKSTNFHLQRGINPIRVLLLARRFELDHLLPCALYDCCQLQDSTLLRGYVQHGVSETLSPQDLERCLVGRKLLESVGLNILKKASALLPSKQCKQPVACVQVVAKLKDATDGAHFFVHSDPLRLNQQLRPVGYTMCGICEGSYSWTCMNMRTNCWAQLNVL